MDYTDKYFLRFECYGWVRGGGWVEWFKRWQDAEDAFEAWRYQSSEKIESIALGGIDEDGEYYDERCLENNGECLDG